MSSSAVGITQIGQIAINVHDLERAVAFYRDILGIPFLYQFPGLAFFQCGEVRLMLGQAEKPEFDHPGSVLYYKVRDIHQAYHSLKDYGASLIDEPHLIAQMPDHELWMFFLSDLEGNTLGIMAEVPLNS